MTPSEATEIKQLLALAQYRATWQHLQAAVQAARTLMHELPAEEMAQLLVLHDEQPETDDHVLLSLVAWLREVAEAHAAELLGPALADLAEPEPQPLRDSGVLRPFPYVRQARPQPVNAVLAGD